MSEEQEQPVENEDENNDENDESLEDTQEMEIIHPNHPHMRIRTEIRHIPFGQRVTNAINLFFSMLANSLIAFFNAPVGAIRILCTSYHEVQIVDRLMVAHERDGNEGHNHVQEVKVHHTMELPESDEDWKKLHDSIDWDEDEENQQNKEPS